TGDGGDIDASHPDDSGDAHSNDKGTRDGTESPHARRQDEDREGGHADHWRRDTDGAEVPQGIQQSLMEMLKLRIGSRDREEAVELPERNRECDTSSEPDDDGLWDVA